MLSKALIALAVLPAVLVAADKPTFNVNSLPDKWEEGQVGTNSCAKYGSHSQKSLCQNVFINNAHDWCLFGPIGKNEEVGENEEQMISYCLKSGYGTRLIPDGTLKRAHFIRTKSFFQITGFGDFTKIGVKAKDDGGELDPHGATGAGNPPGGLIFSRTVPGAKGEWTQLHEWSNFMSASEFSIRACFDSDPDRKKWCPHIYDVMGSQWNHPGDFGHGFSSCEADNGHFPGIYVKHVNGTTTTSKFWQGDAHTPDGHKPGKSSECTTYATLKNGPAKVPVVGGKPTAVPQQVAPVKPPRIQTTTKPEHGKHGKHGKHHDHKDGKGKGKHHDKHHHDKHHDKHHHHHHHQHKQQHAESLGFVPQLPRDE